MEISVQA
jgi:hypothetical protein